MCVNLCSRILPDQHTKPHLLEGRDRRSNPVNPFTYTGTTITCPTQEKADAGVSHGFLPPAEAAYLQHSSVGAYLMEQVGVGGAHMAEALAQIMPQMHLGELRSLSSSSESNLRAQPALLADLDLQSAGAGARGGAGVPSCGGQEGGSTSRSAECAGGPVESGGAHLGAGWVSQLFPCLNMVDNEAAGNDPADTVKVQARVTEKPKEQEMTNSPGGRA